MATAISLCSRALLKLGANTIASFDEGTAEAEVAGNLYPGVRDALLSVHPWNFATGQATLARLTAVPVADFANAYQLPADYLRGLSVGVSERGRGEPYRIAERRLHTDAPPPCVLTYIFRPDEQTFPAFFADALVAQLAAEFCIPVTDNTSRAELMIRQAEAALRKARLADAQEEPPAAIQDFTLISVRG